MVFRQVKPGYHLALICPFPHKFRAAAPTKHKTEAIEQNGFPRPGFTGQNIQTGAKMQLQMINDQHIADR